MPADNVFELTLAVNEDGVVALAVALVESHGEPDVTCTVKATPVEPEALVTLMFWAAGAGSLCRGKGKRGGRYGDVPGVAAPVGHRQCDTDILNGAVGVEGNVGGISTRGQTGRVDGNREDRIRDTGGRG